MNRDSQILEVTSTRAAHAGIPVFHADGDWRGAWDELLAVTDSALASAGGLLLKGLGLASPENFQAFALRFGDPLLSYDFASTPRSSVGGHVYTSTEYPNHQSIPLHNEQSYARQWPMRIWFHCAQASVEGGATPVADSRVVHDRLDPALRQRFERKRLMYVRNYGQGLDLPWQQVFGTEDRLVVAAYCRAQGIDFEWARDGELRTRQICQAVARHPVSGAAVWFNQAHLFHVSALEPAVREALLNVVDEPDLPRNVYYGDGSPLEAAALDEIRQVYREEALRTPWETGDVLMLDNMLMAHGRDPFKGPRKVVVAMARPSEAPPGLQ